MTNSEKDEITTINFALHPNTSLRVSFHKSIPVNPHQVVNKLFTLPDNATSDKFVIMDAKNIVSLDQISIAANTALLRRYQFAQKNGVGNCRGLALETMYCCAGSTNTASVLKDYGFNKESVAAKEASDGTSGGGVGMYDVFCLGYCESDEEFRKVTSDMQLGVSVSASGIKEYLLRTRDEKEMNSLMKVYKIRKDEIEMYGSSLEKAVCNRVAGKFFI